MKLMLWTVCQNGCALFYPVHRYPKGRCLLAEDPKCVDNSAAMELVVGCTLEPALLPLLQLDELKQ